MMAITAFSISFTVLALFLAFKLFENAHPIKMYSNLRRKGDALVISLAKHLHIQSKDMKKHLSVRNVLQVSTRHTATAVAKAARAVETRAQNITRRMARDNSSNGRPTASKFLEEVTTHKQSLDTERVRRENSFDDELEK